MVPFVERFPLPQSVFYSEVPLYNAMGLATLVCACHNQAKKPYASLHVQRQLKHFLLSSHLLHTMYLAGKVYPVPFLPHISLNGISRYHWLGEASLDALHLSHVIPTVLPKDVPSGNAIGTQPVKDGGLET